MAIALAETTTSLAAFTLPAAPCSVKLARSRVRAALHRHGLAAHADNAEAIIAELASNAVMHAHCATFGVQLLRVADAVAVIVTDLSPAPPVIRPPDDDFEHGRGLRIVAGLSARWGWTPQASGKAVYAILTSQGEAA